MTEFNNEQIVVIEILQAIKHALRVLPQHNNMVGTLQISYDDIFNELSKNIGKRLVSDKLMLGIK